MRGSGKDWNRLNNFFTLLEKFDTSHGTVQSKWHDKAIARTEMNRWEEFRDAIVRPAMDWWRRKRYEFVVNFLRRAVDVYERQKAVHGGLDFTDLLMTVADGLKSKPELREYFQRRFTHLLVDEFQDTDPIQAEMILFLTADDSTETEWHHCKPRRGSLFLVGDPKQSIYRFRRGDIVTYRRCVWGTRWTFVDSVINQLSLRRYVVGTTAVLQDPASLADFPNSFFDVTGDGNLSVLDALRVINALSRQNTTGRQAGESEEIIGYPQPMSQRFEPERRQQEQSSTIQDDSTDRSSMTVAWEKPRGDVTAGETINTNREESKDQASELDANSVDRALGEFVKGLR